MNRGGEVRLGTSAKHPPGKPEGTPRWVPVAGALVGIVGLAWAVVSFFLKAELPVKPPAVEQKAEANGGTAINAAGDSKVFVRAEPSPASAIPAASQPSVAASQSARAASGGTAVNATDSAEVVVKKP